MNVIRVDFHAERTCAPCRGYGRIVGDERTEGVAIVRPTRRCDYCNGSGAAR